MRLTSTTMATAYQVSDGRIVLTLRPDPSGGFVVTSPTDPAMITEAETIEEAFRQARDAFAALAESRADPNRWDIPAVKRRRQRLVGTGT